MQVRKQPENLRLRAVAPLMTVNDLEASIAWYRDVLGFFVADVMEHEGKRMGATLKAGSVEFHLSQDDFAKGRDRNKGEGFRIYCTTGQDIDQLAEDVVSRGGKLDHGPTEQPWGTRDFALRDPDGFKITISTP